MENMSVKKNGKSSRLRKIVIPACLTAVILVVLYVAANAAGLFPA